jgi:hypothetical protein
MRHLLAIMISLSFFSEAFAALKTPPHIGPMGGRFNRIHTTIVEKQISRKALEKDMSEEDTEETRTLKMLLDMGKRASAWLNAVNATRPADQQLDLSNPNSSGGYPITKAAKSNTSIILASYHKFLAETSPLITKVITENQEFPTTPPVSDEIFVKGLRALDKVYQNTIRWSGSQEWLEYYAEEAVNDIRGYYFLNEISGIEEKLQNYGTLSESDKENYSLWLLGLCRNAELAPEDCSVKLNQAIAANAVNSYYNSYKAHGERRFNDLYTVSLTRPEMYWEGNRLMAPFLLPEKQDVTNWLKTNVEEEWQTPEYSLIIDYKTNVKDIPRIEFKPGVTAHVNGIAGDLITMEAEYPIESIDQKWTIRHEYGHVLGFNDCYLEFYDVNEKAMIYYEVDTTNLMCSRSGKLKPTHFEQLLKAYK